MKVLIIPVTPFEQNCSLLICEETGKATAIDPGGNLERVEAALAEHQATLEKVFLTHGHIDHCGQARVLAESHQVPLEGPQRADLFWIQQLPQQAQMFGFEPIAAFEPDRWLEDGDTVTFGAQTLEVLHCPGHTPGHVVFFHRAGALAIVGDVLFQGSIGRTDFPGSDHAALINAITTKLWPLGDEVQFVPGHGPSSTFGEEREHNAFVSDRALRR